MASIKKRENESLESMLHRFKRSVNDAGILADIKKHEFYKSPSQKKREKRAAAQLKKSKADRAARRFNKD